MPYKREKGIEKAAMDNEMVRGGGHEIQSSAWESALVCIVCGISTFHFGEKVSKVMSFFVGSFYRPQKRNELKAMLHCNCMYHGTTIFFEF